MSFKKFPLHSSIQRAIEASGYTSPTPIQEKAIPIILAGKDIRGSAQTGTGKTAAFLLPALQKCVQRGNGKPRILILSPTRELATQIAGQADKYSQFIPGFKSVCLYGGMPYERQLRQLKRPVDLIIATPGRLIDLIDKRMVNLSQIEMLVLDEADRMLDMGFIEPVEQIASLTPKTRQTLLFSATMKGSVQKLSKKLLNDPIDIEIQSEKLSCENIRQNVHFADDMHHKNRLLDHILQGEDMDTAIIFTSTKRHCDELSDELNDKGFFAGAMHGDMNQRQRNQRIRQMTKGTMRILVATDVAARGIDISSITHVINYDLPMSPEDYVHRIGRTGRAGRKGTAWTLVSKRDSNLLKRIEQFTGQSINIVEIPGLEAKKKAHSSPRPQKKKPSFKGNRSPKSNAKGHYSKRSRKKPSFR